MKFLDKGIISTSAQNIKFTTNKQIQFSLGEEPPESSGDIQLPPKTPAASPTPSPKEVSRIRIKHIGLSLKTASFQLTPALI